MCPTTERDLGDGIGPTRAFAAAGVPMALGSDSHAVIDLFEEARAVELDERLRTAACGVTHRAGELLRPRPPQRARSIGWPEVGTLTAGRRARHLVDRRPADHGSHGRDRPRPCGGGRRVRGPQPTTSPCRGRRRDVVADGRHSRSTSPMNWTAWCRRWPRWHVGVQRFPRSSSTTSGCRDRTTPPRRGTAGPPDERRPCSWRASDIVAVEPEGPPPTARRRRRAVRVSCRGSSTATPISCSPVTGATSSWPAWQERRIRRAASSRPSPPLVLYRTTSSCAGRGPPPRGIAQRHHVDRDQSPATG